MCGIIGFFASEGERIPSKQVRKITDLLLLLSESRGKEAAGVAVLSDDGDVRVLKVPVAASQMIASAEYDAFFSGMTKNPLAIIGHSRLMTNGTHEDNRNNQPVRRDGLVAVHNGIVVNDGALWAEFPHLQREAEVDTEVILALTEEFRRDATTRDLRTSVAKVYDRIEGTASILLLSADFKAIWATNCGSLYFCENAAKTIKVVASERYILQRFTETAFVRDVLGSVDIHPIKAGFAYQLDLHNWNFEGFRVGLSDVRVTVGNTNQLAKFETQVKTVDKNILIPGMRRCSRCILPETMPFIDFDEAGVCNYCRDYSPMQVQTKEELEDKLAPYRSRNGEPDCIVAFSGGRDSCYGLHYIKKELGMNPIAYTYDWGMVTDLARRNQARICGKLGIEHILVSADIAKKRANIRKNVEAWLRKPDLGMVPLFMAGDKQFYYYANQLKKQTGVKLLFFCAGIALENTDFKTGFCGIPKGSSKGLLSNLPLMDKIRLALYYGKNYLFNPSYINSSIADTVFAFFASYFMGHDYAYLYHYLRWDEKMIMDVLLKEYDWELASDTDVVWRIGDGSAPFYNYIYHSVAGFTENDTFRSNQIREGMITRDDALRLVALENQPRYPSMKIYFEQIGVTMEKALRVVDSIPKLYSK